MQFLPFRVLMWLGKEVGFVVFLLGEAAGEYSSNQYTAVFSQPIRN